MFHPQSSSLASELLCKNWIPPAPLEVNFTTMILKDVDNFRIHRLRVIHLYADDLTALLSVRSQVNYETNYFNAILELSQPSKGMGSISIIALMRGEQCRSRNPKKSKK